MSLTRSYRDVLDDDWLTLWHRPRIGSQREQRFRAGHPSRFLTFSNGLDGSVRNPRVVVRLPAIPNNGAYWQRPSGCQFESVLHGRFASYTTMNKASLSIVPRTLSFIGVLGGAKTASPTWARTTRSGISRHCSPDIKYHASGPGMRMNSRVSSRTRKHVTDDKHIGRGRRN